MSATTRSQGAVRATRPDEARRRAWLSALIAVLLVLVYLSVQLTYASTHLPPPRYRPLAPGAVAHGTWADFRLLSLQRTTRWGEQGDGEATGPDPGSVWVVARLEVTPRRHQEFELCTLLLASTDGRSWEASDGAPAHEGAGCVPDDAPAVLGVTYPVVVGYEVPTSEVDHLAGLGLEPYGWRPYLLLRPPA